jgi:hypothetical protein
LRMPLSKDLIRRSFFSSEWLSCSFAALIVGQFLDGLTTKIGIDLGLAEVSKYAIPVLGTHGFWGLMAWKYCIIAALGAMYLLVYYGVKKYDSALLKIATAILTIGCFLAVVATVQVDVSNILQIQLALNNP